MEVRLAYGSEGLIVDLPDDGTVTVIESNFIDGVGDERLAVTSALRTPVGTSSLRDLVQPSDNVAIVFSDLTRPMPNDRVLPPLLDELKRGSVPCEQIVLINALGTHRPQTRQELVSMLGEEIVEHYQIIQHDAWDESNLVPVVENHAGRMVRVNRHYLDASIRILTGFIEPHLFAGFSGGPKAVLPGIADIDAILDNHSALMVAHSQSTWAVTRGNPVWEEMLEVAQATQPTFLLNVALNARREITGVFAGKPNETHDQGIAFVRQSVMQEVEAPFDVVITSNSGYPLDLNLYQSIKGLSAASQIVRAGGHIILAAECREGFPSYGEYHRLLSDAKSPQALLDRVLRPGFRCHDQWQAQIQAKIQLNTLTYAYTDGLSDDELGQAFFIPCHSIEDTLEHIRAEEPGTRIAILPDGPQTVPALESRA
jgi:nickel-dependent lactate racemase